MEEKYLVTGGAGFIGSHVVDQLCALGKQVTVLDIVLEKDATRLQHQLENITYIEGDIRDEKQMEEVTRGHTHVIHLAAIVSVPYSVDHPVETHGTNVAGTLNVFEAAKKAGVTRVAYASSAAVYGDTDQTPTPESALLDPLSPYGQHKMINEMYGQLYARSYGLPTVGLRFFNVFGSRQDPSSPYSGVVSIFVERAKKGENITVFGDGSNTRDFVHVSNIVSGILLALAAPEVDGSVYNLGSGSQTSLNGLIAAIGAIAGSDLYPQYVDPREGDILHSCAAIDSARSALGYEVIEGLEGGLKELMQ